MLGFAWLAGLVFSILLSGLTSRKVHCNLHKKIQNESMYQTNPSNTCKVGQVWKLHSCASL